jgi:rhodanese-related sulfurtransferase
MTRMRAIGAIVPLLAAVALTLAACGVLQAQPATTPLSGTDPTGQTTKVPVEGGGSYMDVSAAGLAAMLKNKTFPLVNVHIPYEGEIEGTDLFVPYNEIEKHFDQLPADKSARVVLYCRSGSMSATAARTLVRLGYTDVWNLDGGMIAWKAAGYSLLNKEH